MERRGRWSDTGDEGWRGAVKWCEEATEAVVLVSLVGC